LGPLSRKLAESVKMRVDAYRAENGLPPGLPVPADAVTASGSGLDPHISVENALLQVPRVAQHRGLDRRVVDRFIRENTEDRSLGILGEPRVNVLKLNLALDRKK
jgi:K+-transporting ATPase ATPase C chain